jgi:hypothetical protein
MWAFDQTARISEYTKPELGDPDHCMLVNDLTVIISAEDSVRGSDLFPLSSGETLEGATYYSG